MEAADRVVTGASRVLHDVATTTALAVTVSPWRSSDTSIGWAVHPAATSPTRPVWETYQLLSEGDSLALHPLLHAAPKPGDEDDEDILWTVAGVVQDLVQMLLWARGLEPTWPVCPAHPSTHRLRVDRQIEWSTAGGHAVIERDTGAQWTCPQAGFTVHVGELARPSPDGS